MASLGDVLLSGAPFLGRRFELQCNEPRKVLFSGTERSCVRALFPFSIIILVNSSFLLHYALSITTSSFPCC